MKKRFLSICCVFLFLSCEEDIVYTFETTRILSSDFELCEYELCPKLLLNYITVKDPELIATTVNAAVTAALIERLTFEGQKTSSIKEAVAIYLSNAQNSYPETSAFSGAHELQIDVEVGYSSNDVLSLQIDHYEFAGGAHGVGGVHFLNYNPKTGQQLDAGALFEDMERFIAFAKAKFIQTHGSLDQFWFEDEKFTLPSNIGFNQEGLILFYNVYEIASYAAGTFELRIPWKEIEDYLSF